MRIGCQDTPSYKSRYCDLHKPKVPVSAKQTAEGTSQNSETADNHLGVITGKRVTRASVLYEVRLNTHTHCDIYTDHANYSNEPNFVHIS